MIELKSFSAKYENEDLSLKEILKLNHYNYANSNMADLIES